MSNTTHLDRKEIKQPDAFILQTGSFFHFIQDNIKAVLFVVGVVFLLTLTVFYFNNVSSEKALVASGKMYTARKALTTALEKAPKTDADWEKKVQPEVEGLSKVAAENPKSYAAYEANMALGEMYLGRAKPALAAEQYVHAADASSSKLFKLAALRQAASAYENAGKHEDAARVLQQILDAGEKALKADAMMALGRSYELRGDKSKANEQYSAVAQQFPNTPIGKAAETQKSLVK